MTGGRKPARIPSRHAALVNAVIRLLPIAVAAVISATPCRAEPVASAEPAAAAVPAPYVDRVLDDGEQADVSTQLGASSGEQGGWPRGLQIDYSLASSSSGSPSNWQAVSARGFLELPNYGVLSYAGSAQFSRGAGNGASSSKGLGGRVDLRAVPMDGGWLADYAAGNIGGITPPLARGVAGALTPNLPIAGVAGEWTAGEHAELNAFVGRAGVFNGWDSNELTSDGGARLASLGGQWRIPQLGGRTANADIAFQLLDARGGAANSASYSGDDGTAPHARSLWASTAWEGPAPWGDGLSARGDGGPIASRIGGLRVQASVLRSSVQGETGRAGTWVEAAWRSALLTHTAGAYYLQPGLRWGQTNVASDLRGAYWRADTGSARWRLGWNAEFSDSVSGQTARSAFGSVNGLYRVDTVTNMAATLSVRSGSGAGQSLQLKWDRASAWGHTAARVDTLSGAGSRVVFAGVDQSWPEFSRGTLSTSIGWQKASGTGAGASGFSWGVLGTFSPSSATVVNASVRGATGRADKSLFADINAQWQIGRGWSLVARYSAARGSSQTDPQVTSALSSAIQTASTTSTNSRFMQVMVRYEEQAGSASAPLGGAAGSGAGEVSGTVYVDANENGRRDASEAGVPNAIVLLDGRYVARTDSQGRYSFPAVAAGPHRVQLQGDSVPLPWTAAALDPTAIVVGVRRVQTHDLAVQALR